MRKPYETKWCKSLIFIILVTFISLLTSCTSNSEITMTETQSSQRLPSPTEPINKTQIENSIQGTVEDALMNTLIIATEDEHHYEFDKGQAKVITGSTGMQIGNLITVYFYGDLKPEQTMQDVKVTSIVAEDSTLVSDSTNETSPLEQSSLAAKEKAQNLLAQMSLEEKVGQMFIARLPEEGATQKVADYHLGGYILFARDFEGKTKKQAIQNIQSYQANSSIPLLIGVDEEGGTVNRISKYPEFRAKQFQSPQALYQSGGFEAIINDTTQKCQLLQELGINLNFAPVSDVSQNPDDFMYNRSFGKDAQQTAQYVETVVKTMKEQNMGSVLKHFPGYGNNEDTHTGIAYDNRSYETFTTSDFLPFQAGINAGANVVLVSHNIVTHIDSQYPASLSPRVHEILREDLGFSGVIVTDDLYMEGVRQFADDKQVAILAVQAGNDLICSTDFEVQISAILNAVAEGSISEARINESVLRILEMKISLGLI